MKTLADACLLAIREPQAKEPAAIRAQHFEFQKLHGMGDDLYAEVIPADRLNVPCRVYAPVGSHEDLLPYLVRRLLENGANSSFVNRITDEAIAIAEGNREMLAAVVQRECDKMPPGCPAEVQAEIGRLRAAMLKAAPELEFEQAAGLRDRIVRLEKQALQWLDQLSAT